MSALCCCRGLFGHFWGKDYPIDVVAQTKLDQKRKTNYASMEEDSKNANGSINNNSEVNKEGDEQSTTRHKREKSTSTVTSARSRKSRTTNKSKARSFDESDSNTSSDSEEENLRQIRKSIRMTASMRSSRNNLVSQQPERLNEELTKEQKFSESSRDGSEGQRMDFDQSHLHHVDEVSRSLSPSSPEQELSPSRSTFRGSRTSLASERQFQRKTIRRSPDPSQRSSYSDRSSEWAIDAESIYRQRGVSPDVMDSASREIALAQEASHAAPGLPDDEDDEFQSQSVEPISACGTLDVAVQYILSEQKLHVTIIEAHDLPSKARGGASILQVRAVVLPMKKKRYKTKVQHIENPRFAETFKLSRASPEDLKGLALRLRMYGIRKVKDRLIGEAIIRFDELNLIRDPQLTIQLQLEPRADINRGESDATLSQTGSRTSSMLSLSHGGNPPELLVGLSYNPPTGRLCVEVIKGSHFRNMAMPRPPDTFVKLSLLNSSCQEMSQSKTTIRRGQPNPVFKETFYFQVAKFQLAEVTLMISVFHKRTMKGKEMIGWVLMGRNSSSDPDQQHWQEMQEGKGQQVCRWHTLSN